MGYEQTYLSALELDKKGPPTREFIDKLVLNFQLSHEDLLSFLDAADASKRKFVIEHPISKDAYLLIRDFRNRLPELVDAEIDLVRKVLFFKDAMMAQRPKLNYETDSPSGKENKM